VGNEDHAIAELLGWDVLEDSVCGRGWGGLDGIGRQSIARVIEVFRCYGDTTNRVVAELECVVGPESNSRDFVSDLLNTN
jgi:hypothetical protein